MSTEGLAHMLHQAEPGDVPNTEKDRKALRERAGVSVTQLAEAITAVTGRPCKPGHVSMLEKLGTCPNESPDSHDRAFWAAYQRALNVFQNT